MCAATGKESPLTHTEKAATTTIPPHAAHRSPILAPVFILASAICLFAAW